MIIAAHPDDEILGCGGTLARLIKEGHSVSTLILGEGVTSRDEKRDRKKRKRDLKELRDQTSRANKTIGVEDVFTHNFPDNRFDTVALLDIIKIIEKVKSKVKPNMIYTHCRNDLNIDHRICFNAALTACRPTETEAVTEIYSFYTPSSTEWSSPYNFSPNLFYDISDTIDDKIRAIKEYKSELKVFPYPRSIEGIRAIAKYWGMCMGVKYAEPFEVIRIVKG